MFVLIFSTNFFLNHIWLWKEFSELVITNVQRARSEVPVILVKFWMKQLLEKSSKKLISWKSSSRSQVIPRGQTDRHDEANNLFIFRNFANPPKKNPIIWSCRPSLELHHQWTKKAMYVQATTWCVQVIIVAMEMPKFFPFYCGHESGTVRTITYHEIFAMESQQSVVCIVALYTSLSTIWNTPRSSCRVTDIFLSDFIKICSLSIDFHESSKFQITNAKIRRSGSTREDSSGTI